MSIDQKFLSKSEQQVLIALEAIAARTNVLPKPHEVQKEMRRLKLVRLGVSRIGQNMRTLENHGRIVRSFAIVKSPEAAVAETV